MMTLHFSQHKQAGISKINCNFVSNYNASTCFIGQMSGGFGYLNALCRLAVVQTTTFFNQSIIDPHHFLRT